MATRPAKVGGAPPPVVSRAYAHYLGAPSLLKRSRIEVDDDGSSNWTPDEQAAFERCVTAHGRDWGICAARYVPSRTIAEIRAHADARARAAALRGNAHTRFLGVVLAPIVKSGARNTASTATPNDAAVAAAAVRAFYESAYCGGKPARYATASALANSALMAAVRYREAASAAAASAAISDIDSTASPLLPQQQQQQLAVPVDDFSRALHSAYSLGVRISASAATGSVVPPVAAVSSLAAVAAAFWGAAAMPPLPPGNAASGGANSADASPLPPVAAGAGSSAVAGGAGAAAAAVSAPSLQPQRRAGAASYTGYTPAELAAMGFAMPQRSAPATDAATAAQTTVASAGTNPPEEIGAAGATQVIGSGVAAVAAASGAATTTGDSRLHRPEVAPAAPSAPSVVHRVASSTECPRPAPPAVTATAAAPSGRAPAARPAEGTIVWASTPYGRVQLVYSSANGGGYYPVSSVQKTAATAGKAAAAGKTAAAGPPAARAGSAPAESDAAAGAAATLNALGQGAPGADSGPPDSLIAPQRSAQLEGASTECMPTAANTTQTAAQCRQQS